MDTARERLQAHRQQTVTYRLTRGAGLGLLTSRSGRRLAAVALNGARLLGPERLARLPGVPASAARLLRLIPPAAPAPQRGTCRPSPCTRGDVYLFRGCTGALLDRTTEAATERLLRRLGYRVLSPPAQGCCGALHQHNGDPQRARQLALENVAAFAATSDPIVSFASGCAAHLRGYGTSGVGGERFAGRISDIVAFLAAGHAGALRFRPTPEKIALYVPCTQRNQLGRSALMEVLRWIPGLQLEIINPEGGCCGAAGSYMVTQPETADQLGDAVAERVIASGVSRLLTTNIGCALHLGARLRQRGAAIEIAHPVTLLDAQAL
jgi:glycolate oxidase iron-sulfur subunit